MTKTETTGKKILVVDDEPELLEVLAYDLKREGFSVTSAVSGEDAIKKIKAESFDMVISDVRMPNGTGVELLKWVRDYNHIAPGFIFMTAFADISSAEALDQGAEAFLTKPFDPEVMLDVVKEGIVPRLERWRTPVAHEPAWQLQIDGDMLGLLSGPPPRIVIGGGGMFVERDNDFPSSLEIVPFKVPFAAVSGAVLEGHARVRWVRHERAGDLAAGIGLEFLYLTEESRRIYIQHLQIAQPKSYVPLG